MCVCVCVCVFVFVFVCVSVCVCVGVRARCIIRGVSLVNCVWGDRGQLKLFGIPMDAKLRATIVSGTIAIASALANRAASAESE